MDGSRMKQELDNTNNELLKKLQELDSDIIFSKGWHSLSHLGHSVTHCMFSSAFLFIFFISGSEFVSEENCIFVGMVTEDIDVSELVNTIVSLGKEIEESGRVIVAFLLQDT